MSLRSLIGWCLGLIAGLVTFWVGVMVVSAYLVVRALASALPPVLASLLESIATYVYLMATMEIVAVGVIWATRGPVLALAWIATRFSAWGAWN